MQEKVALEKKKPVINARRGERRVSMERRSRMEEKKTVAKIGMSLSMGTLIATGLMRGRGAKTLHIWSGMALVGFSVWHYNLYQPATRRNKV